MALFRDNCCGFNFNFWVLCMFWVLKIFMIKIKRLYVNFFKEIYFCCKHLCHSKLCCNYWYNFVRIIGERVFPLVVLVFLRNSLLMFVC